MPKKVTASQKGKSVDDETTSRAPRVTRSQGESHSEIPFQTSHTLPSLEEIRRAPAPASVPPVPQPDAQSLEMRDVIQLLTRLVVVQARHQEVGIGHADRAISAKVCDFINLDPPAFTGADPNEDLQGNMSVREYNLQFDSLAGYAPTIVAKIEDRVHRFVMGLEPHLLNDYMSVSLHPGIDISRIQAYAQGHVIRDCPTRGGVVIVQSARSVASSSSSVCPPGQGSQAPAGCGRGRSGEFSSSGPQNRIYALAGRQDHESSPNVVTAFLSHIISDEGIRVDTQKIEAVKTCPGPTTPTEWTDACERSFQALKDRLTSAPVLTLPARIDGYVIYCDASGIGLGCVLMQHDSGGTGVTIQDTVTSSLVTEVKELQYEDLVLAHYRDTTPQKEKTPFEITGDGVKIEHQKPSGLLQAIEIPTWKWEVINMTTYSAEDYARLYIKEITDGQAERTIQTLEDMLRVYVIDFRGSWDDHLPLIEFAYKNSYHSSIQMAPYEALYGRKCRSHIGWFEIGETKLVGPEWVHQAVEKIKLIRERLLAAQSRHKSYADNRRRDLEF
ncbi:uncharacterized protein [Nicotiana tomentosiformis]|uniref:uncharacterized protein n=1 Tax=Nicotiana tomentosiformis TaxID=4098 RepID=UPI00388C40B4